MRSKKIRITTEIEVDNLSTEQDERDFDEFCDGFVEILKERIQRSHEHLIRCHTTLNIVISEPDVIEVKK